MNSIFLKSFLLLTVLSLQSCYTTSYTSQSQEIINNLDRRSKEIQANAISFKGQPINTLIQNWGPPKSTSSDGSNGKIYTYVASMQFSFGLYNNYCHFYIRPDGIIYHVKCYYTIT